jgi:hypothetical protein
MATMRVRPGQSFRVADALGFMPDAIAMAQHIRSFVTKSRLELHAIINESRRIIERSRQVKAERPLPLPEE